MKSLIRQGALANDPSTDRSLGTSSMQSFLLGKIARKLSARSSLNEMSTKSDYDKLIKKEIRKAVKKAFK